MSPRSSIRVAVSRPTRSPAIRAICATRRQCAGLEKSKGLITALYLKDSTEARWKDDPGFKEYAAFITK